MKHGPIALLDESTPVVCVATESPVLDKVLSNVEEVRARGAADDRDRDRRRRARRRGRRRDDRGRPHRLDPAADRRDPAAAAARLRHRPRPRPQRRPAPQPGQDRHRRVARFVAARLSRRHDQRLRLAISSPGRLIGARARRLRRRWRILGREFQLELRSGPAGQVRRPKSAGLRRRRSCSRRKAETKSNVDSVTASRSPGSTTSASSIVSRARRRRRGTTARPFDFEKEVEPWLGESGADLLRASRRATTSTAPADRDRDDRRRATPGIHRQAASTEDEDRTRTAPTKESTSRSMALTTTASIGVVGDFSSSPTTRRLRSCGRRLRGRIARRRSRLRGRDRRRAGRQPRQRLRRHRRPDRSSRTTKSTRRRRKSSKRRDRPEEATAVASLIPGSDQIEIDVCSDLGEREAAEPATPPSCSARCPRLASPPSPSPTSASSSTKRSTEFDEEGIPARSPPNQLKSTLKRSRDRPRQDRRLARRRGGLRRRDDREQPRRRARDRGQGRRRSRRTRSPTSACCCAATRAPGVTAVSGEASGFSVRERGPRPQAAGRRRQGRPDRDRLRPARAARRPRQRARARTLADNAGYKEAVSARSAARRSAPSSTAPAALRLAEALVAAPRNGIPGSRSPT